MADRPRGRVLVDFNQNAWGRTLTSMYSVRPTELAGVSAPITRKRWRADDPRWRDQDHDVRRCLGLAYPGQGFSEYHALEEVMAFDNTWDQEDAWWRENYGGRPYATGRNYEDFRPAYKYGYESGRHHMGRSWNDVESDLRTGWDRYEGRGGAESTWEKVKDAVRDAWHRVTGQSDLETSRMSESEVDRMSHGGRPRT